MYLKNNKGLLPREMTTSNDVIKLFDAADKEKGKDKNNTNENGGGFFANLRNNRQI